MIRETIGGIVDDSAVGEDVSCFGSDISSTLTG